MTVKIIEGDIFDGSEDIIVQQVNCLDIMGGGFAKEIFTRFPEVKKEYHRFNRGMHRSFSHSTTQILLRQVLFVHVVNLERSCIIANMYSQENIRVNKADKTVYTDYSVLAKTLREVRKLAIENSYSVAIPYGLGAGMANGDWDKIYGIILDVFEASSVSVSVYKLVK